MAVDVDFPNNRLYFQNAALVCGFDKNMRLLPMSASYEHNSILKLNSHQIISLAVKQEQIWKSNNSKSFLCRSAFSAC